MKQMLKDIGIEFLEHVTIHCDNTSIVSMSKNHVFTFKDKAYIYKVSFSKRESCKEKLH